MFSVIIEMPSSDDFRVHNIQPLDMRTYDFQHTRAISAAIYSVTYTAKFTRAPDQAIRSFKHLNNHDKLPVLLLWKALNGTTAVCAH